MTYGQMRRTTGDVLHPYRREKEFGMRGYRHRGAVLFLGWLALLLTGFIAVPGVQAGRADEDKIVLALERDQDNMDPHMHFQRVGILMNINMYDSLLHKNPKLEYEPSLATAWRPLNDTTWEFALRRGVKFHNGDPFTAADVKFSFERVLDPATKSPQYGNIRAIKEVRIIDDYTVHLVTDKPFPLLLERMVFFPIIPKKHFETVGAQAFAQTAPVGTGPYKFVEWRRDQYLHLERFAEHWRGPAPIKTFIIRVIPETSTQVAELKTGGVDIIRQLPPDLMPDLKSHPNTYVSAAPILRTHYVALDMRVPPFDKKEVRQAANYAIDRQAVIERLMGGLGRVVPTVINPMAFGFDPTVEAYGYDPQKAKALLAQAGYPNGVDITLHVGTSYAFLRQIAEAIAEMLSEVGLRTNLKIWDPGPAWDKFFQGEGKATHGFYGTWGYYSTFDADAILHPLYHTEPGGWVGKWYTRVAGLDELIDEARSTVDRDKRLATYAKIQRLIKEEAPSIFLWHQYDMLGIARRVVYEARGDEWIWVYDAKLRR
jgi:peptide/nickel transport system substrate-binding protein